MERVSETADRVIRCARGMITDIEVDQHLERDRSRAVATGREQPNERSFDDTLNGGARVGELEDALRVAVSYYQDQLGRSGEARARRRRSAAMPLGLSGILCERRLDQGPVLPALERTHHGRDPTGAVGRIVG